MGADRIDVLAVVGSFLMFGGTLAPRQVVAEWNTPRPTGLITNRARSITKTKTPTATVLRALKRAERDGIVECVGTGEQHCNGWNRSAADKRECYWRLTDFALARVQGGAA